MTVSRPPSRQPLPAHARKVFGGQIFEVYQWPQKMFDGSEAVFEKLKRPDTVIVFPVLPDGRILLTRQEQPGKAPFLGGCGGRVEPDEDVVAAARREMLEETGYEAEELVLWQAEQPLSKVEWAVYVFVAHGVRPVAGQALDSGEKVELTPVTFEVFLSLASDPSFAEKEIVPQLYEARLNPEKHKALAALFRQPQAGA